MRGKGVHAEPSAAVIGITPAYAGKSSCGGQTRFPCRDHPRLCGEKLKRQIESKQLKGSPPPMRGKGMRTIKAFPNRRITPAYAGKRNIEFSKRIKQQGSPPPMRGKVQQFPDRFRFLGITPAYAGKSRSNFHHQKCNKDHPRLCGEKVILNRFTAFTIGSPPPMRGKVVHSQLRVIVFRITPAYAGKRQRKHVRHAKPWDHPRLCGEKTVKSHRACQAVGSPPPMRGKDRQHVLQGRLW